MAFHSYVFFLVSLIAFPFLSSGWISKAMAEKIKIINVRGEHYGLAVAGEAELKVFLGQGMFQPFTDIPAVDISGRRFHVGTFEGRKTILAMSGSGLDVKLDKCVRKSLLCLQQQPKIKRVDKVSSAVNNLDYINFLHTQLEVNSIHTESAPIAMVFESENKAFLGMRSITDHAGSSEGNDETVIKNMWYFHASASIAAIFKKLASADFILRSVNIW